MRGVFGILKRKIGPWTTQFFPEVAEAFYDPEKRAIGVGDGTINGVTMLTEDQPQEVTNKTIDAGKNTILHMPCVGALIVTAGDFRPDASFLACDGSQVLRTQYDELFRRIGTTYGVGDGTTTFRLPPTSIMGSIPNTCKVWIKARP